MATTDESRRLNLRKQDLLEAIRVLEADHQEGMVDDRAYAAARHRYELEAAEILERLDALPPEPDPAGPKGLSRPAGGRRVAWITTGTLVLVLGGITVFLVTSLHARSANQSITGSQPSAAVQSNPSIKAALAAAQQQVKHHPGSYQALLVLGNAYLKAGKIAAADKSYLRAFKLDPGRPEAPTLHAMVLGADQQDATALADLREVERAHPRYARAWLLDGLLATHSPSGYHRAVASWQHFLALDPHNPLAKQVRRWIAGAEKAEHVTQTKKAKK